MARRTRSLLVLVGTLTSGCFGHQGYGYHDSSPPSAGALVAAAAITVLFHVAEADAQARSERSLPRPQPVGLTGAVLWQGKPDDLVPSLPVTLERQGHPIDRTTTDLRGRFAFPGPLPPGVYRLVIDDQTLRGSMMFMTRTGSASDLALSAYLR